MGINESRITAEKSGDNSALSIIPPSLKMKKQPPLLLIFWEVRV